MAQVTPIQLGAESIGNRWVNDIWGWKDPNTGNEYALVGMTNGTSFVDVTDPVNPIVLGVLKEHNWNAANVVSESTRMLHDGAKSLWRDIKVYGNYAYIVSEDPLHGIQVFDLTDLRNVVDLPVDFQEAGHYGGVGAVHNIHINEETGYLYAVGFNDGDRTCSIGGLHIVDLADPVNPVYAGCFDEEGYIHDTQCVIYTGPDLDYQGKEICFNSNGNSGGSNTITIVNTTSKISPELISEASYQNAFYAHQGWLTEGHKYFLSDDELDEESTGQPTKTFIWDIQDLDNPELIGTYVHGSFSIDHNLYIKGNRVYQSNYTSGLRVLNTLKIAQGQLSEDMFFDTYPADNSTDFWGTWSNYPFFESGNVIVSDFTGGLFVVQPMDIMIDLQPQNISMISGKESTIEFSVIGNNLTFQWQVNTGGGFVNLSDLTKYEDPTAMSLKIIDPDLSDNGNAYRCVITDSNGTQVVSNSMMITDVVLSTELSRNISVYPNPTDQLLHIDQIGKEVINAELYSLDGTMIQSIKLREGRNEMPTAYLPNGMYLLKLISLQSDTVCRVVIQ
jgi:choice-of-anchor B domain-containing protein